MSNTDIEQATKIWHHVVHNLSTNHYSTNNIVGLTKSIAYDHASKVFTIEFADFYYASYIRKFLLKKISQGFEDLLRFPVEIQILPSEPKSKDTPLPLNPALQEVKQSQEIIDSRVKELEKAHYQFYQSLGIEQDPQTAAMVADEANQGLGGIYQWNGLNFRSKPEIKIAEILDERGVLYFPNARGRLSLNYKRVNREADFLVCHEGRWGILECDGEAYHQSAADDHARDLLWNAQGIWFIKRFSATDCEENPIKVVDLFLEMLRRFNSQSNGGKP